MSIDSGINNLLACHCEEASADVAAASEKLVPSGEILFAFICDKILSMKIITNSPEETQNFASEFAKNFTSKGVVIALSGDLGAGKTTFTQGFAKGLGIYEKIISPTFVLIRQHPIPFSSGTFFHIDLYRLEGKINLEELGLIDIFQNRENIVLIEWAEKIKEDLPENITNINIEKLSESQREIIIEQ